MPLAAPDVASIAIVAVGVALTLVGERRGDKRWQWVGKPAASAAFVVLAVLAEAPTPILAALALSAIGDVLLIPRDERVFRLGVVAFLLAHLAYIVAFWRAGLDLAWLAGSVLAFSAIGGLLVRRVLPGVGPSLRGAVVPYVVVITAMVAAAVATRDPWLFAPALMFYANDVALSQHRFVRADWRWRLLGLPLYYAAQVVFATAS